MMEVDEALGGMMVKFGRVVSMVWLSTNLEEIVFSAVFLDPVFETIFAEF